MYKRQARIIYNGSVGMSQATELPELAHSYEYAEFYNKEMCIRDRSNTLRLAASMLSHDFAI